MTREEAKSFWQIRYENAKDFSDPYWEAQERRIHREYIEALRMAIEALSVDRKGHWIDTYGDEWVCSNCGVATHASEDYHSNDDRAYKMNFCHYCGADMRKEEDDYDYERAIDNLEYNTIYEPAFNLEDGSM